MNIYIIKREVSLLKKVFDKRKVMYLTTIFVISTIVFTLNTLMFVPATSNEIVNKNRIIVLDAGHGGADGGAVSKSGILEKELNLKITFKVKELLEDNDIQVILTRNEDVMLYDNENDKIAKRKVQDVNNRIEMTNNSNADMLVSIHMNSFPQNYCKGWQIFYKEDNQIAKDISIYIQDSIKEIVQNENDRVAQSINNVKLINKSKIPAIIVECGFLSNEDEAKLLTEEEYQNKLAKGICKGIMKWYN